MNSTHLLWLSGLLLIQPAQAQLAPIVPPQVSQSIFTGISVGVRLDDAAGSRLRFRTPGTTTGSTQLWDPAVLGAPSAEHPDYTNQALFSRWTPYIDQPGGGTPWSSTLPQHNPVFGDMSTGADLTPPVDSSGVLDMSAGPDTAWYSLSFTVGAGAMGVPGSVFSSGS